MSGRQLRHWTWIELALIPAAAAIMRVSWAAPLLFLSLTNPFTHPSGLSVPIWWLLIISLAPGHLARVLRRRRWSLALMITLGIGAVLASWALAEPLPAAGLPVWIRAQLAGLGDWSLGIPARLTLAAATVLLWQRGIASQSVGYAELWRGFMAGSIVLAVLLLLPADVTSRVPGMNLPAGISGFILSGLIGLALVSLTGSLASENLRIRTPLVLSRHWLAVVAATSSAVLLLGWAAGLALAPHVIEAMLLWLKPLWSLFSYVLLGMAALLAYALLWIIQPLMQATYDRVMPLFQGDDLRELRRYLFETLDIGEKEPAPIGVAWSVTWRPRLVLALMGLGIWLIGRAWRARTRRPSDSVLEKRESILTASLLRAQIASVFRSPRARAAFLAVDSARSGRDAIRALYQRLLAEAGAAGMPRQRGMTPGQYATELLRRWPQDAEGLLRLTRLYVAARYGPQDPDEAQVDQAHTAYQALSCLQTKKPARDVSPRRL